MSSHSQSAEIHTVASIYRRSADGVAARMMPSSTPRERCSGASRVLACVWACRVVLDPGWAAAGSGSGSAEGHVAAQQPEQVAQPRTTATVGGTAAGELTGNTHFIVQQPDNTVDVAIHTERLSELKAAAAAQAAADPRTQVLAFSQPLHRLSSVDIPD